MVLINFFEKSWTIVHGFDRLFEKIMDYSSWFSLNFVKTMDMVRVINSLILKLTPPSSQLETELRGHMDKLRQLSATKSLLQPLAQHGALLWRLLRRLGDCAVSWEGFASVFHSAVERTHHQNPELWSAITATEAGGRGRCSALRELQKATDQATLQDAA